MKKNVYLVIICIFTLALCILAGGCNGGRTEHGTPDEDQTADITAHLGQVIQMPFGLDGDKAGYDFTVSDPNVLSVQYVYGYNEFCVADVKCLSVGKATLKVTSETKKKEDWTYQKEWVIEVQEEGLVSSLTGDLITEITVHNSEAELYKDDTTVTYKIKTANTVDHLELIMMDSSDSYTPLYSFEDAKKVRAEDHVYELYTLKIDDASLSDAFVPYASGKHGKAYSASKEAEGEFLIWNIQWNLGNTAVNFVEINAYTEQQQKDCAYVNLNIHYPVFDAAKGMEPVIYAWVRENLDSPMYFEFDTSGLSEEDKKTYFEERRTYTWMEDENTILMHMPRSRTELSAEGTYRIASLDNQKLYDAIFDASPIYRGNFISSYNQYGMLMSLSDSDPANVDRYLQIDEPVLATFFKDSRTDLYYYTIQDETRAVIAYRNGYEIDPNLYPIAYSILERARAVLGEIITDTMTDFEKEQAIYKWMVSYQAQQTKNPSVLSEDDAYYAVKTAYGFLNGYGGDGMGYSGTFYTLCNMAGVACSVVDVYAIEPGETGGAQESYQANHRINLVRIQGEYYFVEPFWFYQKENASEGDYRFLNMTGEKASQYYQWKTVERFGPVECNYSGYLVDEHTGELLKK